MNKDDVKNKAYDVRNKAYFVDLHIVYWMKKHGIDFLRWSLGIVFIWFGILKPIGLSPVIDLVTSTVYWVDPSWFVPFLGWWEVVIGLSLLYKPLIRLGVGLMALQMIGTLLPLVLLPQVTFNGSVFAPTLEGQYIIKNIVLISAALVIGSHAKDNYVKY